MNKKKISLLVASLLIVGTLTGCMRAYDVPEYVEITPSQTAFLIPMVGATGDQQKAPSEDALKSNMVMSKRVQIPHMWIKTGRLETDGKYMPSAKLIVVERKPTVREWTEQEKTGTSNKNEGIVAESKESIGFMTRWNASAQIDEDDAVRFLYRYNGKSLDDIMDSEIRARVESKFVSECAKRTLEDILVQKGDIIKAVSDDVIPYFKDRGINITTLGMKGEFTYLNADIQKSIDEKFKSAKSLETQKNENDRVVSKAQADADAVRIQASTIDKQIQLKQLDVQMEWIKKWSGNLPQVSGADNVIYGMPTTK
jgi:hypothetical protein